VEETALKWEEIWLIASSFPNLNSLYASGNGLSLLTPISSSSLIETLSSVHLEFNEFIDLSDISALTSLRSLRTLNLKGNRISHILPPFSPHSSNPPVFSPSLSYLDISYNRVSAWSFADSLPTCFPGLTSLRFAHNPIYDNPELDNGGAAADISASAPAATAAPSDESYMLLVARVPGLRTLNFSSITPADRANAEMFYLSRIARQLAAVEEGSEAEREVLRSHRRWAELCALHGEPTVVRRREVDAGWLDGRLVSVTFHLALPPRSQSRDNVGQKSEDAQVKEEKARIPKSFDMYTVMGIVGRLFGLPPLGLKLVWETGEWDPVAGFDEEADDSSEDEEIEAEVETRKALEEDENRLGDTESLAVKKGGRWVKREVELKAGPRQFGYCVDGLDVTVRVEAL
jgi:hypothetical protein